MVVDPFIPFLLFVLALYATPGPATMSLAANGATNSFSKGVGYAFGLVCGIFLIFLLVAAGLGLLFQTYPLLHEAFKWVSLGYMIYLSYKIARVNIFSANGSSALRFWDGVIFNLLNPKAYFAIMATVAQFAQTGDSYTRSMISMVCWVVVLVTGTNLLWFRLGNIVGKKLSNSKFSNKIGIVFAVILLASVLLTMF